MELFIIMIICQMIDTERTERTLQYPGRNEKLKTVLQKNWEIYYKCLNESNQQVLSQFILPGQSARLNCTECRKPFDDSSVYTWKQRSMDLNATIVDYVNLSEAFALTGFNDLVISNARVDHSGFYQCFRGGGYLSTHIIEIPEQTVIVPINNSEEIYEKIDNSSELEVEWGAWSKCSKCGTVGKKFQYGVCVFKTNTSYPFHKLSCFSRFLDYDTQNVILSKRATHFAVVQLCKVDCESNDNTGLQEKRERIKGLFQTALQREIVHVHQHQFLILQCPGISDENIPITWKVLNMEIIPGVIDDQTKGRIQIDLFHRLQFHETKQQDSKLYSCWQQEKLIGVIHLDVEDQTKTYGIWLPIFTAVSMISLAIHIALKALQHKKLN